MFTLPRQFGAASLVVFHSFQQSLEVVGGEPGEKTLFRNGGDADIFQMVEDGSGRLVKASRELVFGNVTAGFDM